MIGNRERGKRAAARRRIQREFSGDRLEPTSLEGGKRGWFYVAAGALIIALVAFVTGVQMGKTLSDGRRLDGPSFQGPTPQLQEPPFRLERKEANRQIDRETRPRVPTSPAVPAEKVASSAAEEKKSETPAKGKYTLQVAAFNNPAEARDLVNQLKDKGYEAYQITGSAAAKGTLHRVRIGHFPTLQEARQFAWDFEKREKMKTIISTVPNP